jgi:hypothetical protein
MISENSKPPVLICGTVIHCKMELAVTFFKCVLRERTSNLLIILFADFGIIQVHNLFSTRNVKNSTKLHPSVLETPRILRNHRFGTVHKTHEGCQLIQPMNNYPILKKYISYVHYSNCRTVHILLFISSLVKIILV